MLCVYQVSDRGKRANSCLARILSKRERSGWKTVAAFLRQEGGKWKLTRECIWVTGLAAVEKTITCSLNRRPGERKKWKGRWKGGLQTLIHSGSRDTASCFVNFIPQGQPRFCKTHTPNLWESRLPVHRRVEGGEWVALSIPLRGTDEHERMQTEYRKMCEQVTDLRMLLRREESALAEVKQLPKFGKKKHLQVAFDQCAKIRCRFRFRFHLHQFQGHSYAA